jgi:hypothetical protein
LNLIRPEGSATQTIVFNGEWFHTNVAGQLVCPDILCENDIHCSCGLRQCSLSCRGSAGLTNHPQLPRRTRLIRLQK